MTNHAGHQVHFLERLERVDGEEQELALKLYNDAMFVRTYLENAAIPEHFTRVALALSDDAQGPHVVVTREGTFVTCLGAGMEPRGLYVLPRSRTVVLHGYLERMREAFDRVLNAELNPRACLAAVRRFNYRLPRERFEDLQKIAPLYYHESYTWMLRQSQRVSERRRAMSVQRGSRARRVRKLSGPLEANLREYWEDLFLLSHMTVVSASNADHVEALFLNSERSEQMVDGILCWLFSELLFGVSVRALWCAAAYGHALVPKIMHELRHGGDGPQVYYAMVMAVIALRDPQHYRPIHGLMRAWKSSNERIPPEDRSMRQWIEWETSEMILPALERPDEVRAQHLAVAREQYASLSELVAGTDFWFVPPDEVSDAEVLGFYQHMLFDQDGGTGTLEALAETLPFLATASATDLYAPEAIIDSESSWDPGLGVEWLAHLGTRLGRRRPQRVEKEPGRNELCPCESGQKYKRCCARAHVG